MSFIKKILYNNRLRKYSQDSYGVHDNSLDNNGNDFEDVLPPQINRTMKNARYVADNVGFVAGIIKNKIDKTNTQLELSDPSSELSSDEENIILNWMKLINLRQIAKEILTNGLVDGEALIKIVVRYDKAIGSYIKPIFLEIGEEGYSFLKEFNDDGEVLRYLHKFPRKEIQGNISDLSNLYEVSKDDITLEYNTDEIINVMYNEKACRGNSPTIIALDDIYMKVNLERNQVERINKDNIIEVKPGVDADGNPYLKELSVAAKDKLAEDYGNSNESNVAIVPPGIESKILGGNNYQSDYTRQVAIFERNILRAFLTPQTQAGAETNKSTAEVINDSEQTGFIVNLRNDCLWVLSYINKLLEKQLLLLGKEKSQVCIKYEENEGDILDNEYTIAS